jgi:hypothetical protein
MQLIFRRILVSAVTITSMMTYPNRERERDPNTSFKVTMLW